MGKVLKKILNVQFLVQIYCKASIGVILQKVSIFMSQTWFN